MPEADEVEDVNLNPADLRIAALIKHLELLEADAARPNNALFARMLRGSLRPDLGSSRCTVIPPRLA